MPRILKEEITFQQADAKAREDFDKEEEDHAEHPRI